MRWWCSVDRVVLDGGGRLTGGRGFCLYRYASVERLMVFSLLAVTGSECGGDV